MTRKFFDRFIQETRNDTDSTGLDQSLLRNDQDTSDGDGSYNKLFSDASNAVLRSRGNKDDSQSEYLEKMAEGEKYLDDNR